MASGQLNPVLRFIRRMDGQGQLAAQSDVHLLERFVVHRDEGAFTALLKRHGPMVLAVCRRILHDIHEAEDAFQVTFLVLARKAKTLGQRELLGNWLHGVAYRTALKARSKLTRWRSFAGPLFDVPALAPVSDLAWGELQLVLDEEIQRLPAKYRAPAVMCCLEGHSFSEAARQLGWPAGTVAGRLARARELLRSRLTRRGFTLSAGLLSTILSAHATSAAVPAALSDSTVAAALAFAVGRAATSAVSAKVAALTDTVLNAMLLAKLRVGAMLLALALGVVVVGVIGRQALAERLNPQQVGGREPGTVEVQQAQSNTDLFGDSLPPGALVRMGTVRFAQGDSLNSVPILAPDQKTFATVSNYTPHGKGSRVCLWDAVTGKELRHIEDPDFEHFQAVFLKSADLLATFGRSRKPIQDRTHAFAMHFWDPKTGKKTAQQMLNPDYHFEPWALSSDEKWLASAGRTPPVLVRDLKTGERVALWQGDGSRVNQLAFSADGSLLAIGCESKIHFWDWRKDRETHRLTQNDVERLWFSPDGKWLAGSIHGEGVRVWETATFTEVRRFKDPDRNHNLVPGASYPHDVRFFPDGKRLISMVTGVVWDVASGKQSGEFKDFAVCSTLAFSQDGKTATAYCGGRIRRWEAATGKALALPLPYPSAGNVMIHQLGFLPDGKTVASGSPDGAVRLWDAMTGKELRTLAPAVGWDHRHINFLRIAADGTVVVVRNKRMTLFKNDKPPQEIALTDFPGDNLVSVNVSSNGKHLVLAGNDQKRRLVQLWDLSERKLAASFIPAAPTRLETLAISADGRHLLAGVGKTLCFLDARTGEIAQTFGAHPERPAPKPNERRDIGGGYGHFHGVQALSISPEQNLVVSYGHPLGELKLVDVFSETTRHVLRPAPDDHYDLRNAVFSGDGRMLAAESDDGFVDVWEVSSGQHRRRFLGHRSYQTTLAFSPDCTKLASGNRDTTILVWDVFDLYGKAVSPARPMTPVELTAAWADMKDTAGQRAALAMGRMMRSGDAAVRFLKEHRPQYNAESAQLKKWLLDLDSDEFQRREIAAQELGKRLVTAYPLLEDALADNPSLEMRQRIRRLLQKLQVQALSPEKLRDLRGLEVLEHIGTKAAEEVVRGIAAEDCDPLLTQAAEAARKRLLARSP